MTRTAELLHRDFNGLCFVNLVDFDSKYGHRQDAAGYAEAINEFDLWLGKFMNGLSEDDILMITADHGCDPSDDSTDHTREYIPFLAYGKHISPKNLGTGTTFADIGATVSEFLCGESISDFGESFCKKIYK